MKTINLLPKSQKKELELEFLSHQILVFWILIIVSLVLFVAVAYVFRIYLAQVIATNDKLIVQNQQQLESPEYKSIHDQVLTLNSTVADLKNLENHHYTWSDAMLELSNLISPKVQLDQMTFDAASGKIDLTGQAKTRQDVIDFWANVFKSPYFTKINFPLPNLDRPQNGDFNFTFYANKAKFLNQQ